MRAFLFCFLMIILVSCNSDHVDKTFPYILPQKKPAQELSQAVERNYDAYPGPQPRDNELYTQFRYTELKGLDYSDHDGTITRRDPSKVIKANGKYYVWYTKRHTPEPAQDIDHAEIWFATSNDGFEWEEQGAAVKRPPEPNPGYRSVLTPDILVWKEKYYLYYQAFTKTPWNMHKCPVVVSYADSPDGPWTATNKIVIPAGEEGEWDQLTIHDPYPLVHKGKIYLYYKADFGSKEDRIRMQGLAIADDPLGPFKKHPMNPVLNSGHETTLFPFKEGIAAIVILDGNEHFTIQYSPDGVNFDIAAISELMPGAAGPYIPDAFTDTKDGRGITWGISHSTFAGTDQGDVKAPAFIGPGKSKGSHKHSVLMRFDCDLSLDVHYPEFKHNRYLYNPEFYYSHGLSDELKQKILEKSLVKQTNEKDI